MTPQVVMARYRELKKDMSGLEASRQVLGEVYAVGSDHFRTESPPGNKRTGRPKKWASEAERLRAYRQKGAINAATD